MPRGAAPRALLGVMMLIIAIAVTVAPVVDARPKDKKGGNQETVSTEANPSDDPGQAAAEPEPQKSKEAVDPAPAANNANVAEQTDAANGGAGGDQRTLLSSDADGDYLPDALDNCPNVQNPDQADADGDGIGDACPIYQDSDGDGVADKEDNCPGLATYDYADRDGDGIGDACDKSPDGIEPEPEPLPDYDGQGGEGADELAAPVNGEGQDGETFERDGKSRSRQRSRTENSKPIITTGDDTPEDDAAQNEGEGGEGDVITEGPDAVPYEEPARDNPRRNEELVAEAAASGELYAPPQPPPVAQRAWEDEADSEDWQAIVRIDSGVTGNATAARAGETAPNDKKDRKSSGKKREDTSPDKADKEAGDDGVARGWMRARVLLQDETSPEDDAGDGERGQGSAPVPVENGLVITGNERDTAGDKESPRERDPERAIDEVQEDPEQGDSDEDPGDGGSVGTTPRMNREERDDRNAKDGSRRNGSSRAAASPNRERSSGGSNRSDNKNQDSSGKKKDEKSSRGKDSGQAAKKRDKDNRNGGTSRRENAAPDWSDDRYFLGGSALDWTGDFAVAGTDDEGLYLTQRSGSGPGKRRGFVYAIPVDGNDVYLVRLYFAEPYWGAPDGPEGAAGKRVFSVSAEGDALIDDLDIFAEAGSMTALVKQVEVKVDDGELNLGFISSEGEPVVAAIEVLRPSQ